MLCGILFVSKSVVHLLVKYVAKPLGMDSEFFKDMHLLPGRKLGTDDHYISFEKIYGLKTSEDDRPSLAKRKKAKSITISPTEQHA